MENKRLVVYIVEARFPDEEIYSFDGVYEDYEGAEIRANSITDQHVKIRRCGVISKEESEQKGLKSRLWNHCVYHRNEISSENKENAEQQTS